MDQFVVSAAITEEAVDRADGKTRHRGHGAFRLAKQGQTSPGTQKIWSFCECLLEFSFGKIFAPQAQMGQTCQVMRRRHPGIG